MQCSVEGHAALSLSSESCPSPPPFLRESFPAHDDRGSHDCMRETSAEAEGMRAVQGDQEIQVMSQNVGGYHWAER